MTKLIPDRTSTISGSTFCQNNMTTPRNVRQDNIIKECLSGNIPDFLRTFQPITITTANASITLLVMKDYLSIGSDDDYVRMPMQPLTAQKIADQFDCSLPTKKLVDIIWQNSTNKLNPLPWGEPYDSSMMSMSRIPIHNDRINKQFSSSTIAKELTSGHKKDIVLTNRLSPNNPKQRVAIYGWIKPDGIPIQGLNPVSHEVQYEDYSHGVRLVFNDVIVNGNLMRLQDVYQDINLAPLVSDEGILTFRKYE